MEETELPEAPDVIGTVRAYRSWKLRKGILTPVVEDSAAQVTAWAQPDAEATCKYGGRSVLSADITDPYAAEVYRRLVPAHEAPGNHCTCGLYACTSPASSQIHDSDVWGVVECSGVIQEGEANTVIRAQRARVTGVVMPLPDFTWFERRKFRRRYPGVQVFSSKRALLKAFPSQDGTMPARRPVRAFLTRWWWWMVPALCWDFGYGAWNFAYGHIGTGLFDLAVAGLCVAWALFLRYVMYYAARSRRG